MDVSERRPAGARGLRGAPMLLSGSKRLAARAAAGDERAFTIIFERHHQELYRYCLAIVRRPADAEDALQSTMSKALQALPGERREIKLRAWLFRVAHNESISILRDRTATQAEFDDESPAPEHSGTAERAERSERLRELVADLGSLPDRQRSALVMRELSGLGYGEIASALDCGEGAARQTVHEARTALQAREEGRAMLCDEVRHALSDGDRRRLRGRKIRAHLDGCQGCRDFKTAIDTRRTDLAALCPPLPAAAAAGLLGGLLSSGAGGAGAGLGAGALGAGAGSIAGGVGGAAAIKGASIVAALALAVGGADAVGVIDLPNPLRGAGNDAGSTMQNGGGPASEAAPGHPGAAGSAAGAGAASQGGPGQADGAAGARPGHGAGAGRSGKQHAHEAAPNGQDGKAGNSGKVPPGQGGSGSTPNGSDPTTGPPSNSNAGGNGKGNGVPGGGTTTAPGQTGTAPGQPKEPGTSAGNGTPAGGSSSTNNAGGSSSSSSGGSSSSSSGGGSSNSASPGQTGTPPATSNAGGKGKKSADTT